MRADKFHRTPWLALAGGLLSMLLMAPMRPFAGFGNRSVAGKLILVENDLELGFQGQQRVHYAGFMKTILGDGGLLLIEFPRGCNQKIFFIFF